jgi:cystathionine beta-lyase/cystathionine gamma-synthase
MLRPRTGEVLINSRPLQALSRKEIEQPALMTHSSIPAEEREKIGITDTLIRISVGIEDIDDLIVDLKQALG